MVMYVHLDVFTSYYPDLKDWKFGLFQFVCIIGIV